MVAISHSWQTEVSSVKKTNTEEDICLYCESQDWKILYENIEDRLKFVPGSWNWKQCQSCQSLKLADPPSEETLAACYPDVYSFTPDIAEEKTKANTQPSWLRTQLAWLENRCFYQPIYRSQANRISKVTQQSNIGNDLQTPSRKLLDLGCGRGLRMEALRQVGFDVTGLDFQSQVVESLQQRDLQIVVGDAAQSANYFSPASFDVLTAFYLMEHVADVSEVLQNAWQLIKPNGYLVLSLPLINGMQAKLCGKRWIHLTEVPRHLSIPSAEGIRLACEKANFREVTIQADSSLEAAGVFASSLMPGASLTEVYGTQRITALLRRIAGAGLASGCLLHSWMEHHCFKRPSHGLIFAQK